MTKYKITNTGKTGKAYYTESDRRIYVGPGETVYRKSRPPEGEGGWDVEELEEPQTKDEIDEGGED